MRGKAISFVILVLLLGQSVSAQVDYLSVDDFESYADNNNLRAVWKDWWFNPASGNGAKVFVETNPNFTRDSNQSMKYTYTNFGIGKPVTYYGAWAEADATDLEIGTNDWTSGGVKAMVIYFFGDPCNGRDTTWVYDPGGPNPPLCVDQMYIALEDGSANEGVLKYDTAHGYDMNDIKEAIWHEWNIVLQDFNDAGVALSNVSKVYLGFGGPRVGQAADGAGKDYGGADTVYFEDIRLYLPRCLPELVSIAPDFTDDCIVDYCDIDIMATDWLLTDGYFPTENRPAALTGFPDETSHWTTDCAVGTGAIEVNEGYNITVTDPRLYGIASMSITAWIKQPIKNEWAGIVSSRERPCPGVGEATGLAYYNGPYSDVPDLGYDWSCLMDCWKHDFELDVPDDGTWTFCALVVDPTGASAYMRPAGSALQTGIRNVIAHPVQQNFAQSFMIGRSHENAGYFKGAIDDVRIYDYNLSFTDVNNLAYQIADPNPWPVYWYKFDETSGYTAADSGTPTLVYGPVPSKANLTDPEPEFQRSVNFRDYSVLANDWLTEKLWPPE